MLRPLDDPRRRRRAVVVVILCLEKPIRNGTRNTIPAALVAHINEIVYFPILSMPLTPLCKHTHTHIRRHSI